MKIAALILGILSGLAGLSLAGTGDFLIGLMSLGGLPPDQVNMAKAFLWGIPLVTLGGAGLAMAQPKMGGGLMALGAVAWVGLGQLFHSPINFLNGAPLALAAVGALLAFGVPEDEGGETTVAPAMTAPQEPLLPTAEPRRPARNEPTLVAADLVRRGEQHAAARLQPE